MRPNIDYHVVVDWQFYSVPHSLRHEQLEARLTQTTVEMVNNRSRVWAHRRSSVRGGFTTVAEHMPSADRAQVEWTPTRILAWAEKLGPATRQLADEIRESDRTPSRTPSSVRGPR